MRNFLLLVFFIFSPIITFLLVTSIGKDFTNNRAHFPEIIFQYAEVFVPKIESYGIELTNAHEYLDQNYGWCTKHKTIVKKNAPQSSVPKAIPVLITPPTPAKITDAKGDSNQSKNASVSAVASTSTVTPVEPIMASKQDKYIEPENLNNFQYAAVTSLNAGFEVFCKDADGDSIAINNTTDNPLNIEIQRYLKKPLIIIEKGENIEVVSRNKFAFYLRTQIGDILVQGIDATSILIFTQQFKLHIVAKTGKVLLSLFRTNTDPMTVTPIKILSTPGSSIMWGTELDLKDGQGTDISQNGPIKLK